MPKLVSLNSSSLQPGAHHYRLIGVEFATAAGVKDIYSIVAFGGDQISAADTPHDLILDRCYVHGRNNLAARRGVPLNSAAGYDSRAIFSYNGSGPFKILNNVLEGPAENIMFWRGGSRDSPLGTVRHRDKNRFFKPMSWVRGTLRIHHTACSTSTFWPRDEK